MYSSGGFDSLTVKYEVAREFAERRKVLVLHIGNHDPSGVHLYGSLDENVRRLSRCAGWCRCMADPLDSGTRPDLSRVNTPLMLDLEDYH